MANLIYGVGAGQDTTTLRSVQVNTSLLGSATVSNYPLLEKVVTDKTIQDQATLDAWTSAQLTAFQTPPVTGQVYVDPSADPVFGSYIEGDEARFRLGGPRFAGYPNGLLDTFFRIVAIQAQGGATAPERVLLTLGPVL